MAIYQGKKAHRFNGVVGLVTRGRCGLTGATISLFNSAQAGIATKARYTLKCETHGATADCDSWAEGRRLSVNPGGWCMECGKIGGDR